MRVDYLQIWLHGDRDAMAEDDASSVEMWNWDDGGSKANIGGKNFAIGDDNGIRADIRALADHC